ncbi:alpha/beta fold hydrolase [Defluviimonas salinarum]|uniref:Alpha/beta hydrolase n=1 Tax=Defluviimonas salinarum TaxID=2992147 RepID=A0ABT3J8R1_9RHOB|nr:alpha/beta hydrolase [Defluviimonas salinarum]MCW3784066.1 alpha/beta hydrolase [Defluviimonas salinarum]
MERAPFHADVAEAPAGETCVWLDTSDGVRVRAAHWREGAKGTVLLFPGRTEYVEKYGPAAAEFAARGYAMATIDWRGQGIADRLLDDRAPGHVGEFLDYQRDVAALLEFVRAEDLPEPYYLVGHSMGGCIGLRAIHDGLPVHAVTFSAPMWGIKMHWALRPVAWTLVTLAPPFGQGHRMVPTTSPMTYVLEAPFEGNVLTRNEEMFAFMRRQLIAHPELAIGGPTLQWLGEALRETRALRQMPSPALPCLTVLGAEERIVCAPAIHDRMHRWPGSEFDLVGSAEHELMMEGPEMRDKFYRRATALFDASR